MELGRGERKNVTERIVEDIMHIRNPRRDVDEGTIMKEK